MTADLPEWLHGPLRFYWIDIGHACGLVALNTDLDAIVDACPYYRRFLIGRTLGDICLLHPDAGIRRLKEQPEEHELEHWLGRKRWTKPPR